MNIVDTYIKWKKGLKKLWEKQIKISWIIIYLIYCICIYMYSNWVSSNTRLSMSNRANHEKSLFFQCQPFRSKCISPHVRHFLGCECCVCVCVCVCVVCLCRFLLRQNWSFSLKCSNKPTIWSAFKRRTKMREICIWVPATLAKNGARPIKFCLGIAL